MSELQVTGKLEKFVPQQSGTTKDGKEWVRQDFIVRSDADYNNLFCFGVFGAEKVENLNKFQKEGDMVTVKFNVSTNEWTDPKTKEVKYFTSLNAWRIEKTEGASQPEAFTPTDDGGFEPDGSELPF